MIAATKLTKIPERCLSYNINLKEFRDPDSGNLYQNSDYEYKLIDGLCNGNPLTNMDEFISVRKEYEETGKFTNEIANRAPNSKYTKFWKREVERCINGYHTGYDFIPGYLYFYWNYTPIRQVIEKEKSSKSTRKRGERGYLFPKLYDGDYYWYHYMEEAEKRGHHAANIKARGKGFSFKGASMLNRNFYLIPRSMSYAVADNWGYLDGRDGLLSKTWEHQSFLDENTEFRTRKLVNKSRHRKSGYKIKNAEGIEIEMGMFSEIIGISLDGDPDMMRGIRGKLILFEESGNNKVIQNAWSIATSSVQEGDVTYGLMVAYGTGGSEGARFEGLNRMVRHPEEFNIYGIPNIFEKGRENQKVGFFFGDYLNKRGYYEVEGKNAGTSDTISAIADELKEREKLKGNPRLLLQRMAEHPLNIEEASLQTEGSPFDVPAAKRQIAELEVNPKFRGVTDYGWIELIQGKPKFRVDSMARYVENFPTNDKEPEGCIAIYEHPVKDKNGDAPFNMYIAGTDPVDFGRDEVSNKYSLASTYIMNTFTRKIVAEYTGRPRVVDDYYENLRRLLMYYNASCMYEANLRGLFVYFQNHGSAHLLAREPKILRDEINYKGNPLRKGFKANAQVNVYGRQLLHKWSIEVVDTVVNENGQYVSKIMMEYIRSKPLLQEMAEWTPEGNFDRVSAMGALMIHLVDKEKALDAGLSYTRNISDDPFWDKMIGGKKTSKSGIFV